MRVFSLGRRSAARRALALWLLLCGAAVTARAADVLLTMPFENVSGRPEYHWIGESFAVLLSDLLDTPGLIVIRPDERNLAYNRIGVRATDLLTRAAVIRIADAAEANLALIGTYDIGGEQKGETIAITAKLIETREGRLVGNKVFNFSGPLADLQAMQGQLAFHILYERDPALPYSRDQLVRRARSVPPRAYESFVKGIQTTDPKLRDTFLQRAVLEYNKDAGAGHYAQAIYQLGLLHFREQGFEEAAKWFKQLTPDDPHYLENLYYLGLSAYRMGDVKGAAGAFEKLVEPLPMLEVLNNAGALIVARGEAARALPILQRGVAANPNDLTLRFNYGYALWRNGNFPEAIPHLKAVVTANARDGEAQYLLAKSLAGAGRAAEAAQADQEARRYLGNYAEWEVAPARMPLLIRLKLEFNRVSFYRLERQHQSAPSLPRAQTISLQQHLEQARQLIEAKNDAAALNELQQALTADPTLAEAHLLRGKIYQRRNEAEQAINALTAAIYWNPRLVAAHVALGQLYLARGDRARALAHSKQAIEIDPQDRDAIALKRQIEIGR
jgi:tetratricopeptide (TPR) repeat protein